MQHGLCQTWSECVPLIYVLKKKKKKKDIWKIQLKIVIFTAIELRVFEPRREKPNVLHKKKIMKWKLQVKIVNFTAIELHIWAASRENQRSTTAKLISAFVFATWIIYLYNTPTS